MVSNLKREGLDLSKFGPAVQDLIWSTAVQFGQSKTSVFKVPLQGKSELTDKDIVNIVTEYKVATVATTFKSSTPADQASVASRWRNERLDLLRLA